MKETIGETIVETDGVMTGEAIVDGGRSEKRLMTGLLTPEYSYRPFG